MAENEAALRLYARAGVVEYGCELRGLKQGDRYFDRGPDDIVPHRQRQTTVAELKPELEVSG